MTFGELEESDVFIRGTLKWIKMKPCKVGPWLPQNAYTFNNRVTTDCIKDDETVERCEEV